MDSCTYRFPSFCAGQLPSSHLSTSLAADSLSLNVLDGLSSSYPILSIFKPVLILSCLVLNTLYDMFSSLVIQDTMFIDDKANPVLQSIRKQLVKLHSSASRPAPGKHAVTLLLLPPPSLINDHQLYVRRALLRFLDDNFGDEVSSSSSSSSSTYSRSSYFVAASHSRGGKLVLDPFQFINDASLSSILSKRGLAVDVVTVKGANGVNRANYAFVLSIHRS